MLDPEKAFSSPQAFFASNEYVIVACILIAVIAFFTLRIARNAIERENKAYKEIIGKLESSVTDQVRIAYLKKYEAKHFANYEEMKEKKPSQKKPASSSNSSSTLSAAPEHPVSANVRLTFSKFVTAFFSVPRHKHYEAGILPAADFFRSERLKEVEGLTTSADIIIRIGLMLTFLSLAIGLYYASNTIQGAEKVDELKKGIESLISTAAIKFVISVFALFCAVLIKLIQNRYRKQVELGLLKLGYACDKWMPFEDAGSASTAAQTLNDQVKQIADSLQSASAQLQSQLAMVNQTLPQVIESALKGATINIDNQVVEHLVDSNNALLKNLESLTRELAKNGKPKRTIRTNK